MTCSIAGCDRPAKAGTWCPDHYNNWYRRGDPLLGPRPKRLPDRHKPLCDRFWSKVDFSTPDGCWEWRGSVSHELGYGEVWVQGKRQYAHRTAYEIVYGDIPEGEVVRHKCDNPRCVRPEHLLTCSQADNLYDARERGRASQPPLHRGESHHFAKLTHGVAAEIRERWAAGGVTQAELARQFGVSARTIRQLLLGRTWKAA